MRAFNSILGDLAIVTSALLGSQLPAAEPQVPEVQIKQPADKTAAAPREWTASQIYKEIGAVDARISSIDQFFKNHPEQKSEAARWKDKRAEVERFSKDADRQMEGTPSAELKQILGAGLSAVNISLALYNDHLSSLKTAPGAAAPAAATPSRVGIYDVGDFEGMKTSVSIFRALLEARNARNNTAPDATQQKILKALSDIESARDPGELAEKMRPAATSLITQLADQKGDGAKGIRDSLQKLLKQHKPIDTKSEKPAGHQDEASAWKSAWDARLAASTKLNKAGRELGTFADLVNDAEGMKLVQKSAGKLLEHIKPEETELIKQLKTISKATKPDEILKPTYTSLHALIRATELYEKSETAQKEK